MKRFQCLLHCLTAILFAFFISGCSKSFYCYINAFGSTPTDRTYYVTTEDSVLDARLDYKEYFRHLKARLNEEGYIEDDAQASLRVVFELKVGDLYTQTTSRRVNQIVTTSIPASSSTSVTSSGLVFTSNYGGTQTAIVPKTVVNETQKLPIFIRITAVDNFDNKPIWEVDVWDTVDRETQIPTIMPWLIACAKDYFGKSSIGEQRVVLNAEKARISYGLLWPYNSVWN